MARLVFLLFFTITATQFFTPAKSATDPMDMLALGSLYENLGAPKQLTGWRLNGGDPCGGEQPWKGVFCDGSSVISVKIKGLGVGGYLDKDDFSAFASLKELDLSNNNIAGRYPCALPPSATHIDFSHNHLIGEIGDVFADMHALQRLDLSSNHFSGGLPVSITSLTSLRELYLQGNQLTGSVSFLANLPLIILNIESNHFSSCLDPRFHAIPYLFYEGNYFQCHESSSIAHSPNISPAAPPSIAPSPTPSIAHSPNISPAAPPSITQSPTPSITPSPSPSIVSTPNSTPRSAPHPPVRICDSIWTHFVPFCNPKVPATTIAPISPTVIPPVTPALPPTQVETPPENKITKLEIIVGVIFGVLLLVLITVLIVVRVRRSKYLISVEVKMDEP